MAHISSFIDRPFKVGRNAIGSPNLIDFNVTRAKIAPGAVGTTQHGTLNLAKAIGTLSTVDIGSAMYSYGSGGTLAGRILRAGFGSFTGTLRSSITRAPYGSFGTVRSAMVRGRQGSFTGTLSAPVLRGRIGSFGRVAGTLGAARISHGTLAVERIPLLPNIPGTIATDQYARVQTVGTWRGAYGSFGTLAAAGYARGRVGSFGRLVMPGTISGKYGSFGTTTGPLHRGKIGSFTGTVTSKLVRGDRGSVGQFVVHMGTFGRETLSRNTAIAPPPRWRFINWFFRLSPSVANDSAVAVTQERAPLGGTIGRIRVASGISSAVDEDISVWISPYLGSYRWRSFGAAAGTFLGGMEWTY